MTAPLSARKVEMYLDADVVDQLTQLADGDVSKVPDLIRQAVADYLYLRQIQANPSQSLILQDLDAGTMQRMRLK